MAIKHEFSYRSIINAVKSTVFFTYEVSSIYVSGSSADMTFKITVDYQQDAIIPDGEASHKRTLVFGVDYAKTYNADVVDFSKVTDDTWRSMIYHKEASCEIPNNTKRNTIFTMTSSPDKTRSTTEGLALRQWVGVGESGRVAYDPDGISPKYEYMAFPPTRFIEKLTAVNHITDEEAPRFSFQTLHGLDPKGLVDYRYNTRNYLNLCFDTQTPVVSREIFLLEKTTSAEINLTEEERAALRKGVKEGTVATIYYKLDSVWSPSIVADDEHPSIGTSEWVWEDILTATYTLVDAKPVITAVTLTDTDTKTTALTGNSSVMVRYASDVRYVVEAQARKEATISTITAENNSNKLTGATGTFADIEADYFTFAAIDSRGNKIYKSVAVPIVEYIPPTASITSGMINANGECNLEAQGRFFSGSFGAKDNDLVVQYRYKDESGSYSAWQTMNTALSSNGYTATAYIEGLDYRQTYNFQVQVTDLLRTATTPDTALVSKPIFSWSKEDFLFETDVRIKGDLRLKGEGNYGNTLYFGDSSYAYIKEGTDDDLTFRATDITLDATNLHLNGSNTYINDYALPFTGLQEGQWTPKLTTTAAVTSYDVQQGWYMRLGNVITVGFNIKATIKSGYNSTQLTISGLPYTPGVAAFGGGVAHNIYMSGGFCFEGWTADTSGNITARIQPCNNTSAGNLNIASSTYYPSGGGTVTLAGTICYTME